MAIIDEEGQLLFTPKDGDRYDIGDGFYNLICIGCNESIEWELEVEPDLMYTASCCDYHYNMTPIEVELCVIDMLGGNR